MKNLHFVNMYLQGFCNWAFYYCYVCLHENTLSDNETYDLPDDWLLGRS